MSELDIVLSAQSEVARAARPLIEGATVWTAEVVDELSGIEAALEAARTRATEILEQARTEASLIREDAREQGRREGYAECVRDLARARAEYQRLQERAEEDLVALAFQVASRLLGRQIEVDPGAVVGMVEQALRSARGRRTIVVAVHPEDLPAVRAARAELVETVEGVPIHFEVDEGLERGDCVIETESGRIDARLATQIAVLRDVLGITGGRK
jgi:flagellar biosynthesis/type III secretory pathway protein FliH